MAKGLFQSHILSIRNSNIKCVKGSSQLFEVTLGSVLHQLSFFVKALQLYLRQFLLLLSNSFLSAFFKTLGFNAVFYMALYPLDSLTSH